MKTILAQRTTETAYAYPGGGGTLIVACHCLAKGHVGNRETVGAQDTLDTGSTVGTGGITSLKNTRCKDYEIERKK
jgi:hypothetical protein